MKQRQSDASQCAQQKCSDDGHGALLPDCRRLALRRPDDSSSSLSSSPPNVRNNNRKSSLNCSSSSGGGYLSPLLLLLPVLLLASTAPTTLAHGRRPLTLNPNRKPQEIKTTTRTTIIPAASNLRGGQFSDDNMSALSSADLNDEDLDEYIEFLLAAAEDKVSEEDNPLFKINRRRRQQQEEDEDIKEALLQQELDGDEEVYAEAASFEEPLNDADATPVKITDEDFEEAPVNIEVANEVDIASNVDGVELANDLEDDAAQIEATLAQQQQQDEEEDPVALVDDVEDETQLDTLIDTLVASVGDEEEDAEQTVDEKETERWMEEQILASADDESSLAEEPVVDDATLRTDEDEQPIEAVMAPVDEDEESVVTLTEESLETPVVSVSTDGTDSVPTLAGEEVEEVFEEDSTIPVLNESVESQLHSSKEAALSAETSATTVAETDKPIAPMHVDDEEPSISAEDEDITLEPHVLAEEPVIPVLKEEKSFESEVLQSEDAVEKADATITTAVGTELNRIDDQDPEFFLGPSAVEDVPPLVIEAANSSQEEEAGENTTISLGTTMPTAEDDAAEVADVADTTTSFSTKPSLWQRFKGRIKGRTEVPSVPYPPQQTASESTTISAAPALEEEESAEDLAASVAEEKRLATAATITAVVASNNVLLEKSEEVEEAAIMSDDEMELTVPTMQGSSDKGKEYKEFKPFDPQLPSKTATAAAVEASQAMLSRVKESVPAANEEEAEVTVETLQAPTAQKEYKEFQPFDAPLDTETATQAAVTASQNLWAKLGLPPPTLPPKSEATSAETSPPSFYTKLKTYPMKSALATKNHSVRAWGTVASFLATPRTDSTDDIGQTIPNDDVESVESVSEDEELTSVEDEVDSGSSESTSSALKSDPDRIYAKYFASQSTESDEETESETVATVLVEEEDCQEIEEAQSDSDIAMDTKAPIPKFWSTASQRTSRVWGSLTAVVDAQKAKGKNASQAIRTFFNKSGKQDEAVTPEPAADSAALLDNGMNGQDVDNEADLELSSSEDIGASDSEAQEEQTLDAAGDVPSETLAIDPAKITEDLEESSCEEVRGADADLELGGESVSEQILDNESTETDDSIFVESSSEDLGEVSEYDQNKDGDEALREDLTSDAGETGNVDTVLQDDVEEVDIECADVDADENGEVPGLPSALVGSEIVGNEGSFADAVSEGLEEDGLVTADAGKAVEVRVDEVSILNAKEQDSTVDMDNDDESKAMHPAEALSGLGDGDVDISPEDEYDETVLDVESEDSEEDELAFDEPATTDEVHVVEAQVDNVAVVDSEEEDSTVEVENGELEEMKPAEALGAIELDSVDIASEDEYDDELESEDSEGDELVSDETPTTAQVHVAEAQVDNFAVIDSEEEDSDMELDDDESEEIPSAQTLGTIDGVHVDVAAEDEYYNELESEDSEGDELVSDETATTAQVHIDEVEVDDVAVVGTEEEDSDMELDGDESEELQPAEALDAPEESIDADEFHVEEAQVQTDEEDFAVEMDENGSKESQSVEGSGVVDGGLDGVVSEDEYEEYDSEEDEITSDEVGATTDFRVEDIVAVDTDEEYSSTEIDEDELEEVEIDDFVDSVDGIGIDSDEGEAEDVVSDIELGLGSADRVADLAAEELIVDDTVSTEEYDVAAEDALIDGLEGAEIDDSDEEADSTIADTTSSGRVQPSIEIARLNFFYRFLAKRGFNQLLLVFFLAEEWCKVYLSPLAELPGWLVRRESQPMLRFDQLPSTLKDLRGGGEDSGSDGEELLNEDEKVDPVDDAESELDSQPSTTAPLSDEEVDVESNGTENVAKAASHIQQSDAAPPKEKFPISRKRPNGIYRMMLGYGQIGRIFVMEAILVREWIHTYVPTLDSLLTAVGDVMFPGTKRPLKDREDDRVSQNTGFVSSDGSAVRGGKKRKSQTKKDDQKALGQMQQLGDVSKAKYRFLSESFMRRHGLGDFSSDEVVEKPVREFVDAMTVAEDDVEDAEESDAGWVVDALTQDDTSEKDPVTTSMDVAVGSQGASVSVGVEFNFGSNKKKKRKRRSLSEVAMDTSTDAQKVKSMGPRVSDRQSGVMGRIRAAGANSLVGRSLLGAYPGDVPPPHEAASHLGMIDLAYKYGYGDWSDDDAEDEVKPKKSRRRRQPARSSVGTKRSKRNSASIGLGFDLGSEVGAESTPRVSSKKRSVRPKLVTATPGRKVPTRTAVSKQGSDDGSSREILPAMKRLEGLESGLPSEKASRKKRRRKGTRPATDGLQEGRTGVGSIDMPTKKNRQSEIVRPAMEALNEIKSSVESSDGKKGLRKKIRKRKVVKPDLNRQDEKEPSNDTST